MNTLKKGPFTKAEDEALIRGVEIYGVDAFQQIKEDMQSLRSVSQLRTRYNNFLDPTIDKSPWKKEEKQELVRLYRELKNLKAVRAQMNSKRNNIYLNKMKRGASYILTLISIVSLFFGSLYFVAERPSANCLKTSDLLNRESAEFQVPLSFGLPGSSLIQKKEKAVIVVLVRNNEVGAMRRTMRDFEDRFNRKFNYPYVFLNDEPFTDEFKNAILAMTHADVKFGLVPSQMWSVPKHVNETVMNQQLTDYAARGVMYGGSLSYRHMCRFNSGFFYRHPLLDEYDYYWRIEPGVNFYCDLDYDPFNYLKENGKEYGFTIALKEIPETIPTLWQHTMDFAKQHQLNTTLLRFFGQPNGGYNLCHFWSNFEIASLNLWRDERYQAYFDYLDSTGNFFYERWGDAIVHSLAAGLFLNKSQVHFFNDIGYRHDHFTHCADDGPLGKCMCSETYQNADTMWGSCLADWKNYAEEGHRWDFRSNGDQIVDFGQVLYANPPAPLANEQAK
ncbi:glycolipid 2-alpha-mannosyltransferase-domain-containing protein [Choanephora cucurbitarum]|nr:glycolipid 2-alpha-mannosyltransferase-domain-containing protein [Choanephora cucurbitarum]